MSNQEQQETMISNGWVFCLLHGELLITSEADSDRQVVLNPEAACDLLDYLGQHRSELYQTSHGQRKTISPIFDPSIEWEP